MKLKYRDIKVEGFYSKVGEVHRIFYFENGNLHRVHRGPYGVTIFDPGVEFVGVTEEEAVNIHKRNQLAGD